jgi:hypothetical protein
MPYTTVRLGNILPGDTTRSRLEHHMTSVAGRRNKARNSRSLKKRVAERPHSIDLRDMDRSATTFDGG